jgi:hypothetical protein
VELILRVRYREQGFSLALKYYTRVVINDSLETLCLVDLGYEAKHWFQVTAILSFLSFAIAFVL